MQTYTLIVDTEPQGDCKLNYLLDTSRCWSFLKKNQVEKIHISWAKTLELHLLAKRVSFWVGWGPTGSFDGSRHLKSMFMSLTENQISQHFHFQNPAFLPAFVLHRNWDKIKTCHTGP